MCCIALVETKVSLIVKVHGHILNTKTYVLDYKDKKWEGMGHLITKCNESTLTVNNHPYIGPVLLLKILRTKPIPKYTIKGIYVGFI